MAESEVRVAVLTAAGSGMGADAARRLAELGWKVAILSSSGHGEALVNGLGGFGVTGSNLDPAALRRCVADTMERRGRIDALIDSATGRRASFSRSPTRTVTSASRCISSASCARCGS